MKYDEKLPTRKNKIMFIHRSAGAQFEFFGIWLAQNGWDVTFLFEGSAAKSKQLFDVKSYTYDPYPLHVKPENKHTDIVEFSYRNAHGVLLKCMQLKQSFDFNPDIVIAHCGWGVGLCIKQVWLNCIYIAYHEWYYTNISWQDKKIEKPISSDTMIDHRMRNLVIVAEFDNADAHWSPTKYQASRFPPRLRSMIDIIPDGVDCKSLEPVEDKSLNYPWLTLPTGTKILTYMTRGLEAVRGFPQFMRALEILHQKRSDFHTIIVGQDTSFYEAAKTGKSLRMKAVDELNIDQSRVHYFPSHSRNDYYSLLKVSTVHCYFTVPFVTSWSLFEALGAGCLVVGSDTPPLKELIRDMWNGVLVDMDDPEEVAEMIAWGFDNPKKADKLRKRARQQIMNKFDQDRVFPEKEKLLLKMLERARPQEL